MESKRCTRTLIRHIGRDSGVPPEAISSTPSWRDSALDKAFRISSDSGDAHSALLSGLTCAAFASLITIWGRSTCSGSSTGWTLIANFGDALVSTAEESATVEAGSKV